MSRWIAGTLSDQLYFAAPSTLSDYERSRLRHGTSRRSHTVRSVLHRLPGISPRLRSLARPEWPRPPIPDELALDRSRIEAAISAFLARKESRRNTKVSSTPS